MGSRGLEPERTLPTGSLTFTAANWPDRIRSLPRMMRVSSLRRGLTWASFQEIELFCQPLLAEADRRATAVSFKEQFKDSASVLLSSSRVRGAYTKAGADFMKDAIRQPNRYVSGEGLGIRADRTTAGQDRAGAETLRPLRPGLSRGMEKCCAQGTGPELRKPHGCGCQT